MSEVNTAAIVHGISYPKCGRTWLRSLIGKLDDTTRRAVAWLEPYMEAEKEGNLAVQDLSASRARAPRPCAAGRVVVWAACI